MSRKVAMNAKEQVRRVKKIINDFFKTLRAYHFAHLASLREINLRNMFHLISKTISFSLFPLFAFSQTDADVVEMADLMRSNGKIYIVVAVLLIIFLGLAVFLISIDRKVRRLERERGKGS